MVRNFTADQIGDSFLAKLITPYNDVVGINSWNIIAGVSNSNTIGTLTMSAGSNVVTGYRTNLDLVMGDKIIVGNVEFEVASVVSSSVFTVTTPPQFSGTGLKFYKPLDEDNFFDYEFRWSQEPANSDGGIMSEFRPLNNGTNPTDILGLAFDPLKPLWITVRFTVNRLSTAHTISLLSLTFNIETVDGEIVSCPQYCTDCTDPYAMNGCANIIVDCDDNLFNPYALSKPTNLYKQMSDLSTNMFGHMVKYFRVEPDQRSRDVILMEYSLYNVKETGEFKIMVPDNELPSNDFKFDIYGMSFEDFEIHITATQFSSAFGFGKSPRARDYMYFPLNNRMYEVTAVTFADEFNMNMTYWRVMLKKFENRTSSIHTDSAVEQELSDLITGIDEVFGEEIQQEYTQVTKPEQYQTVFNIVGDGIRDRVHNNLTILDTEIRNKWTIISKNTYDLSSISDVGIEAVVYKRKSTLATDESLAVTLWFRPDLSTTNPSAVLLDGLIDNKGLKISTTNEKVFVQINNDIHQFTYNAPVSSDAWYGMVFNLNNKYNQISTTVYKLEPGNNLLPNNTTQNSITNILDETKSITQYSWITTKQYSLMPGKIKMTNIRMFKKPIESEQRLNILQQYVVRDNQLATIIDNAIPSIQLRRYNQAR
jgi:hypothetical protein